MKKLENQNELWPTDDSSNIENISKLETPTFRKWLTKCLAITAILIFIVAMVFAFYFNIGSNKENERMSDLKACQNKCSPRFGEIKGERRLPNASQFERRNYEINAKCVCS
jgi:hypothetical protein